jgi:hypothetical protein
MLMTFALGLASVFVFNGSLKYPDEVPVNLPNVKFEPSTIIFSLSKNQSSPIMFSIEKKVSSREFGGGASGGITCDEARKRAKNKKIKIPNCE